MTYLNDALDERADRSLFPSLVRRHRSSGPPLGTLVALVAVTAAGVGGLFWLRSRAAPETDEVVTPAAAATPAAPDPSLAAPSVPPLDLPPLEASDAFVRELVGTLSAHPRFAGWLVTDELVHRFVLTVVKLAAGRSPAPELRAMAPGGELRVRELDGYLYIDPASYRRYDVLTEAFASLDTRGAVVLYHQLHPLFDEAYRELGLPDRTFDEMAGRALANLLAVQVSGEPLEVRPEKAVYAFSDPEIEALSEADKHLIRMGPDNARVFQAKLRELAGELGIPGG